MKARYAGFMALSLVLLPVVAWAERVTGREISGGRYQWNYGFDAVLAESAVQIRVAVNWIAVNDVTPAELARAKEKWMEAIRHAWDGRYAFVTPRGERYPIRITVTDFGPDIHHEVLVRRHGRTTDSLDWNLSASPEFAAHEFGHMLGANDEYRGGAVGEAGVGPVESVMNNRSGSTALPAHFHRIRDWFVRSTGLETVRVVSTMTTQETGKERGPVL
jgi:hypothetical protein